MENIKITTCSCYRFEKMNSSSMQCNGVIPAVNTKYTDNYQLDLVNFEINIKAQLKAGVTGIIIDGTLGEESTLTADYSWFLPLLELYINTKLVQNIKLAEVATGIGTENVREPRLPLIDEEKRRVLAIIEKD